MQVSHYCIINYKKDYLVEFTQSEHKQFSKRFENDYDIPDERYELWVRLYNSDKIVEGKLLLLLNVL